MSFSKLFEPIQIGTLKLRNRIVMPPMSTRFGSDTGGVTHRYRDYYLERAKGGVGLIIIENTCIEYPRGKGSPTQLRIDNHKFVPALNDLAEAIQEHGAKVAVQLHHAGRLTNTNITEGVELVSASDVGQARSLTIPEIERLIECYADGALRAKMARFDAVELHAAHGYLISQFLSPYINKRTDRYGKDLEGRCRFLVEIVQRIKEKVGNDYPISVRFSADEIIPEGYHLGEAKYVARRMEELGVAILHVSAGLFESKEWTIQPMAFQPGCLTDLIYEVKKEVSIPVIAVGRMNDPCLADKVLQEGKADLIAMGRALLADPELPNKAKRGRLEEIRKCIACNYCIGRGAEGLRIKCAINAEMGREREYQIVQTPSPQKVAVIGGGPAGMEAARVAALRGHHVSLFECEDQLGGQLNLASVPPGKTEIRSLIEYLSHEIYRLGVNVHLSTLPSIDEIKALAPSCVVLATGAVPIVNEIPIEGRKKVYTVNRVLGGERPQGGKVAVIGGGQGGCETAHFLAGSGKKVLLIEMMKDVAMGMEESSKKVLLQSLMKLEVEMITQFKVNRIKTDEALIEGVDAKGKHVRIHADDVVIAIGVRSNTELLDSLQKNFPDVYVIGDSNKPGTILEAIHSGSGVGREI
jgi:2,4-dienoyl-CoA reductase-like NADH-dependent reductase (Old Yellow Enzyme family)/thioredoxin reductase